MSKAGVTAVLIRAAEDARFRNALKTQIKTATIGYDLSDEDIEYINRIIERLTKATNEMERNLFDDMIKPLVADLPKSLMVAKCAGGGKSMANYNCPQSCEACPQSCELTIGCPQSCEACPQSCEAPRPRFSVVNKKPEEKR